MFSDLWSDSGKRTRASILSDFYVNRKERKKGDGGRFYQAMALIKIEKCVTYILRKNSPAYRFQGKKGLVIAETRVGKKLREVFPLHRKFGYNSAYRERPIFSEKPAAFLRACAQARFLPGFNDIRKVRNAYEVDFATAEIMNIIVDSIRQLSREEWFKRVGRDRRHQALQNGKTAARYVARVLNYYARTLVVRLDVGYVGGASAPVSVHRAYDNLHELLRIVDYHPLFEHLVGYIWSFEQGEDKGYHIHLVFFFNGSAVWKDMKIADRIGGELWVQRVTQEAGTYFNCNRNKHLYVEVGIGMINRDNEQECRNAIKFSQYLPKGGEFLNRDDQYLRMKVFKNMHCFGTGEAPERTTWRGRRPAVTAPWLDEYQNGPMARYDADDILG